MRAKIDGYFGLEKDMKTGAVISSDRSSLDAARAAKAQRMASKHIEEKINSLEKKLNSLEHKLDIIAALLDKSIKEEEKF